MQDQYILNDMLDLYIFEASQLLEDLEKLILLNEKKVIVSQDVVNEIFRIMHTIKGSSAMMQYTGIEKIAHSIEDLFAILRGDENLKLENNGLFDLILESVDFIKLEIQKIKNNDDPDGDASELVKKIVDFISQLSKDGQASILNRYKAVVFFDDGCEMEDVRAYAIVHSLNNLADEIKYFPEDILSDDNKSVPIIKSQGFMMKITTSLSYDELYNILENTVFLKELTLTEGFDDEEKIQVEADKDMVISKQIIQEAHSNESMLSVGLSKLDNLLNMVGELVISDAMLTQSAVSNGYVKLEKSTRQMHKIISEIQEAVMALRLVPISFTFHKLQRIVRDMSKKLDKDVELLLIGEEVQVDKNIVEHISDPLMHLIRNCVDHGLESRDERLRLGKPAKGQVILEVSNEGNEILIKIKDDGRGLDKAKILETAIEKKLISKNDKEFTDKEIYHLIFLPGFSTNSEVTEFSGRGVGMDVVVRNTQAVGGIVTVDSKEGVGTLFRLKIPLSLAILDGMGIKVGESTFTIQSKSIVEFFRPNATDIIQDSDNNEMILVRGHCVPIVRLHKYYDITDAETDFEKGVFVLIEQGGSSLCLFVDKLTGQHLAVVKALPNYIKNNFVVNAISGCTLLGDGSISLILDSTGLFELIS